MPQGNLILLAGIGTAAEISPDNADVHYGLGKLLAGSQKITKDGTLICEPDHKNAAKHYVRAIESILTIQRHTFTTLLLQDIGDSNARKHYERAIKIDPSYARAHYHLALLLNEEIAAVEMDKASKALTRAGGSATS